MIFSRLIQTWKDIILGKTPGNTVYTINLNGISVRVKLFPGSGPHAGAWKFYYGNRWHHYRWASKKEVYRMEKSNNEKQKELHKSF